MLRLFGVLFLMVISDAGLQAQGVASAQFRQDATLTVGSRQIPVKSGTPVKVLSRHGDMTVISFTGADGAPVITQVSTGLLDIQSTAPVNPTPVPLPTLSTPTMTPSPTPPPAAAAAPSASMPLVEGWQAIHLPELPHPESTPHWIPFVAKPEEETFHIYVPKGFDPKKTYGLLVWIDPTEHGMPPKKFQPLYDEYGLIAVGVEKAGNPVDLHRRLELAVNSVLEISKWVTIDPNKRILSGLSGGGRASCVGAFCFPDLFSGIVTWCGAHYYRNFDSLAQPGNQFPGYPEEFSVDHATPEAIDAARKHIRYAFLTGTKDFNLDRSQSAAAVMKEDGFKVKVVVQPDMGHTVGDAETMRRGLDYVLNSSGE